MSEAEPIIQDLLMDSAHRVRIEGKLTNVALAKCPHDYWINEEDKKRFFGMIRKESSRTLKRETSKENLALVQVTTYSCQSDFVIRVCDRKAVKAGATGGGVLGGLGGTAGGAMAGATAGSVFPGVGTFVGGVIGGIAGFLAGGLGGAATGAGIGGAVTSETYITITAREVFQELPGFREDDKTIYCEL